MPTCFGWLGKPLNPKKIHDHSVRFSYLLLYSPQLLHIPLSLILPMIFSKQEPDVPVILPEKDGKILARYKDRVRLFDRMFKCCCCWIGWDIFLGEWINLFLQ
jgi:hypothetical protein